MTLNYWMMVERYPDLKEEVGGLIPGREISSLLDKKIVRWSTASYALVLACQPFVSKKSIYIVISVTYSICKGPKLDA